MNSTSPRTLFGRKGDNIPFEKMRHPPPPPRFRNFRRPGQKRQKHTFRCHQPSPGTMGAPRKQPRTNFRREQMHARLYTDDSMQARPIRTKTDNAAETGQQMKHKTLVGKKKGGVRSSFANLSNENYAHPTTLPPPSGGESCPPYYFDLRRRQHPPPIPAVFLLAAALSYMHSNHIEQQPWTVLSTASKGSSLYSTGSGEVQNSWRVRDQQ